jgi:hypothetical protein
MSATTKDYVEYAPHIGQTMYEIRVDKWDEESEQPLHVYTMSDIWDEANLTQHVTLLAATYPSHAFAFSRYRVEREDHEDEEYGTVHDIYFRETGMRNGTSYEAVFEWDDNEWC